MIEALEAMSEFNFWVIYYGFWLIVISLVAASMWRRS
jgi:hypothetical protein